MDELRKSAPCCGQTPAALAICATAPPYMAKIRFLQIGFDEELLAEGFKRLEARIVLVYSTGSESIVNAVLTNHKDDEGKYYMHLNWMGGEIKLKPDELGNNQAAFVGTLARLAYGESQVAPIKAALLKLNAALRLMNTADKIAQAFAHEAPPRRDRDHKQEYYRRRFHGRQCGRR